MKMKTAIKAELKRRLQLALAALLATGFISACSDRAEQSAYVPPDRSGVEDSTLAQSDRNDPLEAPGYGTAAQRDRSLADIEHHEVVEFTGTIISPSSEDRLHDLVETLDRDKPVEIIVATEDGAIQTEPSTVPGIVTPDTADPSQQTVSGAAFSQQVDELRQFMQEQGVQVVQWRFEGSSQDPTTIDQPGLTQDQQAEILQDDLQHVRIVIANDF